MERIAIKPGLVLTLLDFQSQFSNAGQLLWGDEMNLFKFLITGLIEKGVNQTHTSQIKSNQIKSNQKVFFSEHKQQVCCLLDLCHHSFVS